MKIKVYMLLLFLLAACSTAETVSPPDTPTKVAATPSPPTETTKPRILLIADEGAEVLDLESRRTRRLDLQDLFWEEIDLRPEAGISSTGWLAARVLETGIGLGGLKLELVNTREPFESVALDLISSDVARAIEAEQEQGDSESDVVNLLYGGWSEPRWSPDGKLLAFQAALDSVSTDIYLYDLERGNVRRLTDYPDQENIIGWSPDSSRLLITIGGEYSTFSYEAYLFSVVDIENGRVVAEMNVSGSNGVHIFGWASGEEVMFAQYDIEDQTYSDLLLFDLRKDTLRTLYGGSLSDAVVDPVSRTFMVSFKDHPEWGNGVGFGSLETRDFFLPEGLPAPVDGYALRLDLRHGIYALGSEQGAALVDIRGVVLVFFEGEVCPPEISPGGDFALAGTCDEAFVYAPLHAYDLSNHQQVVLSEEGVYAQAWIDEQNVVFQSKDDVVHLVNVSSGKHEILYEGASQFSVLGVPQSQLDADAGTRPLLTRTPKPTSTPVTPSPTSPQRIEPTATQEAWIPLPPLTEAEPLLFHELHMANANVGWAIAAREHSSGPRVTYNILRTEDGGRSWFEVTPAQQIRTTDLRFVYARAFFLDDQHAWVVFDGLLNQSSIWATNDGGRSWTAAEFHHRGQLREAGYFLFFNNRQEGWLLISYFLGMHNYDEDILRTHDGGQTWELILLEDYGLGPIRDFDAVNTNIAWITSGLGAGFSPAYDLHLTRDGGVTWEHIYPYGPDNPSPLPGDCVLHKPRVVSYTTGRVLRSCTIYEEPGRRYFLGFTSDSGRSWRYVEIPGKTYSLGDTYGWAVAESLVGDLESIQSTIYQTRDGGESWLQIGQLNGSVKLFFANSLSGWAISEEGLLATNDGGRTWVPLETRLVQPDQAPVDETARVQPPSELDLLSPENVEGLVLQARIEVHGPTRLEANHWALYAGQEDGRLARWDWDAEVPLPVDLPTIRITDRWIYDLDSFQDEPGFLAASQDGHIYTSGDIFYALLDVIPSRGGEISGVANAAGAVYTSGEDGLIRKWVRSADDSREWIVEKVYRGHDGWVWDVDVSPDGGLLASCGADGIVRLWSQDNGEIIERLSGHESAVTRIKFSPDGKSLASASRDGTVRLWDIEGGELRHVLEGHSGWVADIAYSPDGELLASVGGDGWLMVWNPDSGDLLWKQKAHTAAARAVVFDPQGQLIISAGADDALRLWGLP